MAYWRSPYGYDYGTVDIKRDEERRGGLGGGLGGCGGMQGGKKNSNPRGLISHTGAAHSFVPVYTVFCGGRKPYHNRPVRPPKPHP
jgi:hypothetical protein